MTENTENTTRKISREASDRAKQENKCTKKRLETFKLSKVFD
jgi:hypothetical protein